MKTYQHTQAGPLIVGVTVSLFIACMVIGAFVLKPFLITAPLLLIAGWLFHSLTIEIADGELRWHFGPGLVHKRISLADIASAKVVQTSFLEGWGIHFTRFGWLYNVSGYGAVAITLRNGKTFALGTDEPKVLARHLAPAT